MANEARAEPDVVPIGAGRGKRYWGRFYALLSIAAIVATIGLNQNSGAIVIAAMLLAPLMEPILGIASNLVQGYLFRVVRLLLATVIAAVVTAAWGYVILVAFDIPRDVTVSPQVMARTSPALADLVVALAAGLAGSYVTMRKEEAGLLPGVAIGVSLVPPLAAAGMLLYFDKPFLAGEAALLFLTNLAAIVLSATIVFFAMGMRPARRDQAAAAKVVLGAVVAIFAVVVIAGHLADRTVRLVREAREEQLVTRVIRDWAGENSVEIEKVDIHGDRVVLRLLFGVPAIRAEERAAPADLVSQDLDADILDQQIADALGRAVTLEYNAMLKFEATITASPSSP